MPWMLLILCFLSGMCYGKSELYENKKKIYKKAEKHVLRIVLVKQKGV